MPSLGRLGDDLAAFLGKAVIVKKNGPACQSVCHISPDHPKAHSGPGSSIFRDLLVQ